MGVKAVNLCCSGFKLGEIVLGPGRYEFELVPCLRPVNLNWGLVAVNLNWGLGCEF